MKISDPAFVADNLFLDPNAEQIIDYDGTINFMLRDTTALIFLVDTLREEKGLRPMLPTPQHTTDYDADGWYNFYIDVNEADDGRTSDHIAAVVDSQYAGDDYHEYHIKLSDDVRKALYQKLDAEVVERFGVDLAALFAEAREYIES